MSTSIKSLSKKAWGLMSKVTRFSHATTGGWVQCVTCKAWHPWKEVHAGHFIHISKQHPLSYDKRNINPQCVGCNYFGKKGMASVEYTMYLHGKYGHGIVEELNARRVEPYLRRPELEEIIEALESRWERLQK